MENTKQPSCSHQVPWSLGLSTQGGPQGHGGLTEGGGPFVQNGK